MGVSSGSRPECAAFSAASMHLGGLMVRLSSHRAFMDAFCWNAGVSYIRFFFPNFGGFEDESSAANQV